MNTVQIFQYNDSDITFQIGGESVMIDATSMAKPFGKTPKDWLRTNSAKEFIATLSDVRQICLTELVQVAQGGQGTQGTWMQDDVALEFARWLSPVFGIWCNDRIKELLRFGVTGTPEMLTKLVEQLRRERDNACERIQAMKENKAERSEQERYCETVLRSYSTYTTTEIAREFGMSAHALNAKLRDLGVQQYQNQQWILTPEYGNMGYDRTRTSVDESRGYVTTDTWTVWSERGRLLIHSLLEHEGYKLIACKKVQKPEHLAYKGNPTPCLRIGDSLMLHATTLAKPFGKHPNDYLSLPAADQFLRLLCDVSGLDKDLLVTTIRGGRNAGVWMHQELAAEFARWLDPRFGIWLNGKLRGQDYDRE